MGEQRSATEVLLEIEQKVEYLIKQLASTDLNIKILSNKINNLSQGQLVAPVATATPPVQNTNQQFSNTNIFNQPNVPLGQVKIDPEQQLPITDSVVGQRRTSRDASFGVVAEPVVQRQSNQQSLLPSPPQQQPQPVAQATALDSSKQQNQADKSHQLKVPVSQRIVNEKGKAIFLANITISDEKGNVVENGKRTSANGKWNALLSPGRYKVSIVKNKVESLQDITVGNQPLELNTAIIRNIGE